MKLICVHCDDFDAAPLSSVPRGWVEIIPDPTSLPPIMPIAFETKAGPIADTFGLCPRCEAYRKTAWVVPHDPPPADDAGSDGLLF